ncbi:unnamed protein product, partial [Cuscuta europaea]
MDLLSTCTVEAKTDNGGGNTLTYFLHSVHRRKVSALVLTQTSNNKYYCHANIDCQHFLVASGFDRLLPTRFRSKGEREHKINHFMRHNLILPPPGACPMTTTIHYPDVLQFSLVWCLLDIQDFDEARIPPCMHRQLFKHTKSEAVLPYGTGSWTLPVEAYIFKEEFANFLVENEIPFGTYVLLRHIGNFTFDLLMFDTEGFSRNLGASSNAIFDPTLHGGHFFVYVQSAFTNC